MSRLESIYCYLQHERIKQGQPISYSNVTGNIIVSLCIAMIIFGGIFLISTISPTVADMGEDLMKDIFGRTAGKKIGQLLLIMMLAIIYPIISKTIGTQENFEHITAEFLKTPKDEQKIVAKKGSRFFIFSVIFMIVPIFLKMILG